MSSSLVAAGHTFCTVVSFDDVARAVAECAFATTHLPVILSLEMHCSPKQQARLANSMVESVGNMLYPYHELVASRHASLLSPLELKLRVLVKGKVKLADSTIGPVAPAAKTIRGRLFNRRTSNTRETTPRRKRGSSITRRSIDSTFGDQMARARRKFEKQQARNVQRVTDPFYSSYICLRSWQFSDFLLDSSPPWQLPITSSSESKFLSTLGLSKAERNQIEGLTVGSAYALDEEARQGLTATQLSSAAIVRLAANPSSAVGSMQRRTADLLLRLYPSGLRFSGKNLSPLPGWLAGAQHVALNFSDADLAVTLHFALFDGSDGFVLKPPEMRVTARDAQNDSFVPQTSCVSDEWRTLLRNNTEHGSGTPRSLAVVDDDTYWPPPSERLSRTSIAVLSLHNLPKRNEHRPRFDGSRAACHKYHPELSGSPSPPDNLDPSSPVITLALHPIGGEAAACAHPLQR